ncbi:MAG: ERCC4 domain-containing protein [Pseudomonadota bacterium]
MPVESISPTLVEDTREQLGYSNLFRSACIRDGLSRGDYSVCGLQDRIAIERKSLGDLVGSFTTGRSRFEREFQRARSLDYFAVVVESSLSDLLEGRYQSQANPQAIFQSVMSWSVKYGRPFLFCENRRIGAQTVESLLLKYCRQFVQTAEEIRRAAAKHRTASTKGAAVTATRAAVTR